MKRIRWTVSALADLQSISAYVEAQHSLRTANRVCRAIYDAIQTLRRFPEAGKPSLEVETRELVVPSMTNYVVVYNLISSGDVQVLRVWHGAQQR